MSDGLRIPGVPEAQQDPVLKRYPLRRQRIPIGSGQVSIVIPDDRAWMRKGAWAPAVLRGKEPPYWCRIWPAAVSVARHLARLGNANQPSPLHGLRVLDLGCGIGLPGIQAAVLGAKLCSVDFEADALRFAQWNAEAQPSCAFAPTIQQVDWSQGIVAGTFDLVLLSDVSYHETHHAPIRRQLDQALAADGCVLHADPGRELSTRFLEQLDQSYVRLAWQRRTAYQDQVADVRLTLLARSPQHLARWSKILAVRDDVTHAPPSL